MNFPARTLHRLTLLIAVAKASGLVFKLDICSAGNCEETVLYAVGGEPYYHSPTVSGFDSSKNLYGTTNVGPGSLDGSVFRLNPPAASCAWHAGLLYEFTGGSDGEYPTMNWSSTA